MTIIHGDFVPGHERVGRMVKNAFGVEEIVTLPARHWKHFDWLAEQGKDMNVWLAELDLERHSHEGFFVSLKGYLEMALVADEARRHRSGEDVPLFINPHRPEL